MDRPIAALPNGTPRCQALIAAGLLPSQQCWDEATGAISTHSLAIFCKEHEVVIQRFTMPDSVNMTVKALTVSADGERIVRLDLQDPEYDVETECYMDADECDVLSELNDTEYCDEWEEDEDDGISVAESTSHTDTDDVPEYMSMGGYLDENNNFVTCPRGNDEEKDALADPDNDLAKVKNDLATTLAQVDIWLAHARDTNDSYRLHNDKHNVCDICLWVQDSTPQEKKTHCLMCQECTS